MSPIWTYRRTILLTFNECFHLSSGDKLHNFLHFSLEDSIRHIQLQLSYVYNQILSVITLSHLNKIFTHRVNYDLRRMLSGTEKFIDSIITTMDTDTSYLLGSVRCLPLLSNVRDTISSTLVQHCKVKVRMDMASWRSSFILPNPYMKQKFSFSSYLHLHDRTAIPSLVTDSDVTDV